MSGLWLRDPGRGPPLFATAPVPTTKTKLSPSEDDDGIAPGHKKTQLHAFDSARRVSRAAVADLVDAEG